MGEKLTKAQIRFLAAAERGGVLGFGPHRQVQDRLRLLGLVTMERAADGYYHITEAGRAVLKGVPNG